MRHPCWVTRLAALLSAAEARPFDPPRWTCAAFALAADRAHLVERQRLPLFEAGAEVDLDAIPGRDAVLLVAVVDDGVHESVLGVGAESGAEW